MSSGCHADFIPTPDQIAEECRRIRGDRERHKRSERWDDRSHELWKSAIREYRRSTFRGEWVFEEV